MIDFEKAHDYATAMSDKESAVLTELNQYTQENIRGAHMISGHLQGLFLSMISRMIKPRNIIELGTYTGYATIALAEGLQEGGKVYTIDTDASLNEVREKYWAKSGLQDKISMHIGKALEVLPSLEVTFDLAFIDADKGNYINYIEMLLKIMPKGSFILADNTLFHGDVLKEDKRKTGTTIDKFNQYISEHAQLSKVMLPLRDGVTMIQTL